MTPMVISASRRTDLAGCYPDIMVDLLCIYPPGMVHTIVIWTKNPANLLRGGLYQTLKGYGQLYLHLTITGMGGSQLEPAIPAWPQVVGLIPDLINLVGSADRICWRFDPVLDIDMQGQRYSNLEFFPILAAEIARYGITTCRTSWVSPYWKVIKRLGRKGYTLNLPSEEEKHTQAKFMASVAQDYGFKLYFCAMEGFPASACIDGELLSKLHPQALACSTRRAKNQRGLCGCTESLDIGQYSLTCHHGCLYCYANPSQIIGDSDRS